MLKKRETRRARFMRWLAYLVYLIIGLVLLGAQIIVWGAQVGRRIKLGLACGWGLEPDQVEIVQRIERQSNPYVIASTKVSLHEVMGEARQNAIAPWRLRLVI